MAKPIKMTDSIIEEFKNDFVSALKKMKVSDGKVSFSKSFDDDDTKATVYFTEIAWLKVKSLVMQCDKEIAWHGIAERLEVEGNEYLISDILVYPQYVTGATVNTDQEEYEKWLDSLPDDVFNRLRMQGHSHVNMGVTPSSVDTELYEKLLGQLDDTMFYIFLIFNKRDNFTCKVYDLQKNLFFDTKDCELKTLDEGLGITNFLIDAFAMVKETSYKAPEKKEVVGVSKTQKKKAVRTPVYDDDWDCDYYTRRFRNGYYED